MKKPIKIAIYPGSFDPVHAGHIAVVRQAIKVFDLVLIMVTNNYHKNHTAPIKQRTQQIKTLITNCPRVKVLTNQRWLTAALAQKLHVQFLIRGVRGQSDLDYEIKMHYWNQRINPGLITVFFPADAQHQSLTSNLIRSIKPDH